MRSSSFGRSSSNRSSYSYSHEFQDEHSVRHSTGGAMLPIFLNDLRQSHREQQDLVHVTVEVEDDAVVVHSLEPSVTGDEPPQGSRVLGRSLRKLGSWLRTASSKAPSEAPTTAATAEDSCGAAVSAREWRKRRARLQRTRSSAQQALKGLRFINQTTTGSSEMWKMVELRFEKLAKQGLLAKEDFAECIGMKDTKEFAVGIFDALARRRTKDKVKKVTKEELYDFWLQISDQSFDGRLQIFFDMADRNADGKITGEEIQELLILSASANKLSKLKEKAGEYVSLIMEELDPENFVYIELWQLETLLLQRDSYMNNSRPLSTASTAGGNQNMSSLKLKSLMRRLSCAFWHLIFDHWQRSWVIVLWVVVMACLFSWKFYQYKNMAAFQAMGYCLPIAKGAAETLKLNMALVLLPVCRNTLTWLRSTGARAFIPFDDNINFHKMIASAITIGVFLHAGNHLACDFPRLIHSSPQNFAPISSDFNNIKPTYSDLLKGIEGLTGILMSVLMTISFTLATSYFRKNVVNLPAPLNKLTGFNAFWYSHHLLGVVYVLLFIHGAFVFLVHKWYQKTTWMYISVPLLLCTAERSLRTCRSKHSPVKILKVSILPGDVFSLIMSKPHGFKYKSGQYLFLQCPTVSSFEWHPFSITSAPGDNYLSVHIRIVGDWTQELKEVLTKQSDSLSPAGRPKLSRFACVDQESQPRLLVDGPYGAPAQDYQNYDVLLLVGLGIGATPFISILKDLIDDTKTGEEHVDSNTETSRSDDSSPSCRSPSMTPCQTKKSQRSRNAHFYWVTREPGSFEWFKGVMDEVAEMDHKGQIELHNYLTSVYEESDARSALITMVQALNHAKHGIDILSGTRVRTHFARPNWKQVFAKVASKHPYATVGVFYCGMPMLAKGLKKLSHEMSHKTSTRFEFHKEYF